MLSGIAWSAPEDYNFSEESKLYTKIADIKLNTTRGEVMLSDLYVKSPVILTLIFTRCVGICSPFLNSLSEDMDNLNAKENYKVLVISFDPLDEVSDMERMAKRYEREDDPQWVFAVTDNIAELNESIGFYPVWDSTRQQFDHDALLVGINGNGYIVRKLTGIRGPDALMGVIREINNEFVLSYPLPRENMIFSCFTYDPATGKKKPSLGLLILVLPGILTLLMIALLSLKKQQQSVGNG